MRISYYFLVLFILFFGTIPAYSGIIIINGLSHTHTGTINSEIKGTILIKNDGEKENRFIVYQKDLTLSCENSYSYTDIGSHARSLGVWLTTTVEEKTLQPNESYELGYTITVPNNVTLGTYWNVLMIEDGESIKEDNTQGYKVESKIRYGIQIMADIGTKENSKLSYEQIEFKKDNGSVNPQIIQVKLKNNGIFLALSKLNLWKFLIIAGVKVKVTIYGSQTKRIYPSYCNTFEIGTEGPYLKENMKECLE